MTADEQIAICKGIAVACMWGHGGIGSVVLDELQKRAPQERDWREVFREQSDGARVESVGVVKDEAELSRWLSQGYWLVNYEAPRDGRPARLALFNPPPMNGLCKYLIGELAEKHKPSHRQLYGFA